MDMLNFCLGLIKGIIVGVLAGLSGMALLSTVIKEDEGSLKLRTWRFLM